MLSWQVLLKHQIVLSSGLTISRYSGKLCLAVEHCKLELLSAGYWANGTLVPNEAQTSESVSNAERCVLSASPSKASQKGLLSDAERGECQ